MPLMWLPDLLKDCHPVLMKAMSGESAWLGQVGNLEEASAEYAAVSSERDELRRRQNMLKGALQHIRDAVRNAERELSAHTYVGIDSKYRKQLIELRTTEMAGNDLDKYHKVIPRR